MSSREAPRAATWLLQQLAAGPRVEPLIGDLLEQFAQGRSRLWYWRQALGALGQQFLERQRPSAPSFIGAILAGCVLTSVWQTGCSLVFQGVYVNLAQVKQHPWTLDAVAHLAGMQANMASEYAMYFAAAWLVIHVHRTHQRAVLLAFVAAIFGRRLPSMVHLALGGAAGPELWVPLATQLILAGLATACILVAGLWSIQIKRSGSIDHWARRVALLWTAQMLITGLLFAACRVGELTYRRSAFYLSLYAAGVACGLYLAVLLWRPPSTVPSAAVVNH